MRKALEEDIIPEPNSSRYKAIVERGCGGYVVETMNGNEYECDHNYSWTCDYCPCCIKNQKEPTKVEALDFHWPPTQGETNGKAD